MDNNKNAIKCETAHIRSAIVTLLQGFAETVRGMPPEKRLINER
jgi:hypothetical protein